MFDESWTDPWLSNDYGGDGYSGGYSATAMNQNAASGTDWGAVLSGGISRLFDVSARVYAARQTPYVQTQAGMAAVQAQNNQRMIFLMLAGAALLVVLKRG